MVVVVFVLLAVLLTVVLGAVCAALFYAVDVYRGDDDSEAVDRTGIDRSGE